MTDTIDLDALTESEFDYRDLLKKYIQYMHSVRGSWLTVDLIPNYNPYLTSKEFDELLRIASEVHPIEEFYKVED